MGWYGNDGIFLLWLSFGTSLTFLSKEIYARCQVVYLLKSASDVEQTTWS